MTMDVGLLIGLISIALALFFGIFFGLSGFRKSVTSELSTIKETIIAIRTTVDKTWDLILIHFPTGGGTIERTLDKLGKVRITAEPGEKQTTYLIEIEKPILRQGLLVKKGKEREFLEKEKELLGKEGGVTVLSPTRLRYELPSTDSKTCTEFVTFLLKWLNSTYVESLKVIGEFEEPILT